MPLSTFARNELLDALLATGAAYVSTAVYVSLHTADPGLTGTSEFTGGGYARAGDTAMDVAVAGASANTGTVSFTNMPVLTANYFGLWDAVSAGNFLGGAALTTPRTFTGGENASFAAGDLDVTMT